MEKMICFYLIYRSVITFSIFGLAADCDRIHVVCIASSRTYYVSVSYILPRTYEFIYKIIYARVI